ncbi:MAG: MFS transporter [Streptococcaceae bacterium]|nr:MFS transporter [Streptococcaceae bacterium]
MERNKSKMWLLAVILLSYFAVGFPDGAFTISWLGISYDKSLTIAHSGYILVAYSVTYTLAGVILAQLNKKLKLQTLYFIGLLIMGAGFVSLALAPNFALVLASIATYGFGTGLMAASMNAYMSKHFGARENNWMHCFWGAGATVSPIVMSQMMAVMSWRSGYFLITAALVVIAVVLLISMFKKVWINDEDIVKTTSSTSSNETAKKKYLNKKWHSTVEILTFFFLGGTDYTLVFFTGMVLMSRGMSLEAVGLFSAIYYVCMTVGRMFFGSIATRLKEISIIRVGIAIAIVGIGVLYFTSSIVGMALTGFGLAPLLPTLVSDTSNRFPPFSLSRLVGLELAAFGAGIAVLFFITSKVLEFVTLEALFPIGLGFVILVLVCNEILEYEVRKISSTTKEEQLEVVTKTV